MNRSIEGAATQVPKCLHLCLAHLNNHCCLAIGTYHLSTVPYLSVSLPNLILSGFPWFGLSWCHPLLSQTSAAVLSVGCWWLSCCVSSTADSPSPSGRGPGSGKQTNRPTSKQASAVCPHLWLPLPICWQWKELPPGKTRASEFYSPWLGSCNLWAPVFSSPLSSQGKQKEKEGWRYFVGKPGLRHCCVLQPWPKSHSQMRVLNAGCKVQ